MTRRIRPALLELVRSLAVAFAVLLLLGAVAVIPYRVEQRSMSDTLVPGDLVLVDKLLPRIGGYDRGDIVIFEAPGTWGDELHAPYVKRVVALAGETVSFADGAVLIDGTVLDEPYASGPTLPIGETGTWTLREGELFALGDNRGDSIDSRVFGPIRVSSVIGRVALRYAPPSRFAIFAP